jgi:hypothetical protein
LNKKAKLCRGPSNGYDFVAVTLGKFSQNKFLNVRYFYFFPFLIFFCEAKFEPVILSEQPGPGVVDEKNLKTKSAIEVTF